MKRRRKGVAWLVAAAAVVVIIAMLTYVLVARSGPNIPHTVAGDHGTCTTCHTPPQLPENHADRTDDACRGCHWTAES